MRVKDKYRDLFSIHLAVFLFGLAGLFGKLILLPAVIIVFGRVLLAAFSIGIYIRINKNIHFLLKERKHYFQLFLLGALLAFHWFSFFHSVQLSTVAIALLTFSSFPVFTTILEPWVFNEVYKKRNLIPALLTVFGIFLVVPEFDFENDITLGVFWGVMSGLSFAFLTILNKKYVQKYSAIKIAFYQDLSAALILLPALFIYAPPILLKDFGLLILLGTIFTAYSHIIYIRGLETVKARTASIISSLEPVYGIIFAIILLNEIPSIRTLMGGLIILAIVLYVSTRGD